MFVGGVGIFVHVVVAGHGDLATLHQVLILLDERVYALYVAALVQRLHLVGLLFTEQHVGSQHRGNTVASLHVVVAEHVEAVGFIADDAQQVVAEVAAVLPLDDEGLVAGGFHLRQFGGVGERFLEVVAGYLLVMVRVEPAVLLVDVTQHAVVDGLQGNVALGLLCPLLQLLHGRPQRVGGHQALRVGLLQLSLQQLAVVGFLLGFGHNLAQHLLHCLWQVFLLGLLHLFPQRGVGLSFHEYGYHRNDYGCDY